MSIFGNNKTANEWNKEAIALMNEGKFTESLLCCDEAIKLEPEDSKLWTNKGAILYNNQQFTEALVCLDHSLTIERTVHNTWYTKAGVLLKLKRYVEALHCANQAIEIDPNNANGYDAKANSLMFLFRFTQAMSCFDEAIKLEPDNLFYKLNKAKCLDVITDKQKEKATRKGWTQSQKEKVRNRQNGKCASCEKYPPRWEYHHINKDRSDNSMDNCEGLCPNCHTAKTLGE